MYPFLRKPEIIVTSHLRRCLQTAIRIRETLNSSESVRIIANPDLQEISNRPCDTGSPLDVLRKEFPSVEFSDELFPDSYPRLAHIRAEKKGPIYDDESHILAARAERFRKYLQGMREAEIIVITHACFAHYLINFWGGEPGYSLSGTIDFMHGHAQPYLMPEDTSSDAELTPFMRYIGPWYSNEGELRDREPQVYADMQRDCGIFTDKKMANAIGKE